jgi:hypothetical protein
VSGAEQPLEHVGVQVPAELKIHFPGGAGATGALHEVVVSPAAVLQLHVQNPFLTTGIEKELEGCVHKEPIP